MTQLVLNFILFINILFTNIIFMNKCVSGFGAKNIPHSIKIILEKNPNMPMVYGNNKLKDNSISIEHIFPKSFLYKEHHNDIHNLFLADRYINNKRSNFKFTDDNSLLNDKKNWIKLSNNYINPIKRLFVPYNESKGIIARSILYMSFEYGYQYSKIINETILIEWCLKYRPTEHEKFHNEFAFKQQNKLNKFITKYDDLNYYKFIEKTLK